MERQKSGRKVGGGEYRTKEEWTKIFKVSTTLYLLTSVKGKQQRTIKPRFL